MKNLYFISFLFLIGCGSGAESSTTACYDCGEPTGGMGGEGTGGTNSETGGATLTGGTTGSTGGAQASGGSNTCTPTVSCSSGQPGNTCGQVDDGCGNMLDCGCSAFSMCGGKNSVRMYNESLIGFMNFTEQGTPGICSNGCTYQPMLAATNLYCGENSGKYLWTCPNGENGDTVLTIPSEIKDKNCTNSVTNLGYGAYCCDQ